MYGYIDRNEIDTHHLGFEKDKKRGDRSTVISFPVVLSPEAPSAGSQSSQCLPEHKTMSKITGVWI